jgi:hypothetical protein
MIQHSPCDALVKTPITIRKTQDSSQKKRLGCKNDTKGHVVSQRENQRHKTGHYTPIFPFGPNPVPLSDYERRIAPVTET